MLYNELITSLSFNFCFHTSKVVSNYVISNIGIISDIGISIRYLILDYKNIGYRVRISYQHSPVYNHFVDDIQHYRFLCEILYIIKLD